MNEREEVATRFLVASGDGAEPLQAVEEAFNAIAQAEEAAIFWQFTMARRVGSDDCGEPALSNGRAKFARVVAGVGDVRGALGVLEELLRFGRFVPVTRRQRDVERPALRRGDGVELGRKTSSRTANIISLDPPFPPEASWCARTIDASTSEPVSSTSICNALKIVSQTPRAAHRVNRL